MHPTHYCTECGALWRQCDDGSWNLRSDKAGPCCDNAAMGEQIKPLATPSTQAEPQVPLPFTFGQRRRLWNNSPEIHDDAKSYAAFERIVQLVERAHGIGKQEGK